MLSSRLHKLPAHDYEADRARGEGLIDGFSPVGGQMKSPYIYGGIELDEGDLSPSVRKPQLEL